MKTLALNMIAGPNTHSLMKRCLESLDAKKNFDEIVIVVTTNQAEVMAEAKRWTDKAMYRPWASERYPCGDFAGARNKALENTTTDYFMWVDTDDVVLPDSMRGFKQLREIINAKDNDDIRFFSCPYRLNTNTKDFPTKVLKRERILKNDCIKWDQPVHEQIIIQKQGRNAYIRNFIIDHHQESSPVASVARNIAILEHEIKRENATAHIKLFYGQELLSMSKLDDDLKKREKALVLLKEIVRKRECHKENLAFICNRIAEEYAYGRQKLLLISDEMSIEGKVSPKELSMAETFARMSQSFSKRYAEPDVILGDIYLYKKMPTEAADFYVSAMQKPANSFDEQNLMFYEEIPARRLLEIYYANNKPELAMHYSTVLLKHCPDEIEIYKLREGLLKQIAEKDRKDIEKYFIAEKDSKGNTVAFRAK